MNPDSVFHDPKDVFYVNQRAGEIRLKISRGSSGQAFLIIGAKRIQMNIGYQDTLFDYYVANLTPFDSTLAYRFLLTDGGDSLQVPAAGHFRALAPLLQVPEWSAGSIYYFINPDGFFNGDPTNDPPEKLEWHDKPVNWVPFGGDIEGIIQKMIYITALGPEIIILSPIFTATSCHKLNPRDFASIDPAYGDTLDLKKLITAVHGADKKIILSLVFTHTGTDFPAFNDIVSNGRSSRYADWYRIKSMPTDSTGLSYDTWRSDERFPLFNLRNQVLQNYLIGFVEYWAHFRIDGFYIGENEDIDQGFMRALYGYIKKKYPELLIITSDAHMRANPNQDGCFNRQFTKSMFQYFVDKEISAPAFDSIVHHMLFFRPSQLNCASVVGFHDYAKRVRMLADPGLCKVMYAFAFTFCGSPLLVYGDEIGMTDCAPLNWGSYNWNTDEQDMDLLNTIRNLIKIRKENHQIKDRYFYTLYVDDVKKVYAYDRGGIIVVLNSGSNQSFVELPAWDGTYIDLLDDTRYTAFGQKLKLSVDPVSFRILKREV